MREIVLGGDRTSTMPIDTVVNYGDTGTGKTTWSASWPRPLVLSVADEGGHVSLDGYPSDWLFEEHVKPRVLVIENMADMAQAIDLVRPLVASKQILTIVVSSITFYADFYLAKLNEANPGVNMMQLYGSLGTHLRDLRVKVHGLGCNVVWEALTDHPEVGNDMKSGHGGRPLIAGKQVDKFAAGVGYIFHSRVEERKEGGKVAERIFKRYTQSYGQYVARPRIAPGMPQLPNPMLGLYGDFLSARGIDPDAVRKSLPAYTNPALMVAASKPAVVAKPPVVTAKPKTTAPASSPTK